MPEIWLNYGQNEVVLDIQQENLNEKPSYENQTLDESKLDEKLGLLHFVITFIGMNAVFWPMHQLGIEGMPRRYHTYSVDSWTELNSFISLSALIMGAAQFILAWNLIKSYKYGEESGKDPWGGWSLEWTTTSPPPTPSFHEIPTQEDANIHHHAYPESSGGLFSKMWKGSGSK